ncbi:TIGR03808 family TAT-translocated repetitive protein [Pelagibacterium halotolerans]|uniref:TIGR03808 family TAT-translocated repetitive protein n=1 Tax=Pelagibacterium halotolerans TaxID=531813 RepID=UPI00384FD5C6
MPITRRGFVASLACTGLAAPFIARTAVAQDGIANHESLQSAIDASTNGRLVLPPGEIFTSPIRLPSGFVLSGVPGASRLVHTGEGPLVLVDDVEGVTITGVAFDGDGADGEEWHGGLIHITNASGVTIRDCAVTNTALNGIAALSSAVTIETSRADASARTGIFIYDGIATTLRGNHIHDCGNGGIRVWRGENGPDGAIVTGNRIERIDWTSGGNGQNGNGINVFRADGVIVSDNWISDCAFSAIRLNTTDNCQVRGNTCLKSGEVAIFSEFGFSGSVIANNIVDGAAAGISMTNFNDGGRLATCTGNIVRNIAERSEVNPDTDPYGIAAEADAVISGNVVDSVPGIGIAAGWGPYLRDVTVTGNLVRDADIGILVSVAEDAGAAAVTNNTIAGARRAAIAASRWDEVATTDLAADAGDYPQLTVAGNSVRE